MNPLPLHEFHHQLRAVFTEVNGRELVDHYGTPAAEYQAVAHSAGLVDLSGRDRLCLTGSDRHRFLNGQVTNNVKDLPAGRGCHAAIVNAKARMESDLFIYHLEEELLLDLEPGCGPAIHKRLERFIIADDVTVLDVAPHYGLWAILGPKARSVLEELDLNLEPPRERLTITKTSLPDLGDLYCAHNPRFVGQGYDLYVPTEGMATVGQRLLAAVRHIGGGPCGWQALETHRIESGTPRFGQDMDTSNLPPEAGLEATAIDYKKGCYIGQEVIARLRTYGQVSKALRGLRLDDRLQTLPAKGDKLLANGREVGFVTSAVHSPAFQCPIALGYVRRECNAPGTALTLLTSEGDFEAIIVNLPMAAPVQSPKL